MSQTEINVGFLDQQKLNSYKKPKNMFLIVMGVLLGLSLVIGIPLVIFGLSKDKDLKEDLASSIKKSKTKKELLDARSEMNELLKNNETKKTAGWILILLSLCFIIAFVVYFIIQRQTIQKQAFLNNPIEFRYIELNRTFLTVMIILCGVFFITSCSLLGIGYRKEIDDTKEKQRESVMKIRTAGWAFLSVTVGIIIVILIHRLLKSKENINDFLDYQSKEKTEDTVEVDTDEIPDYFKTMAPTIHATITKRFSMDNLSPVLQNKIIQEINNVPLTPELAKRIHKTIQSTADSEIKNSAMKALINRIGNILGKRKEEALGKKYTEESTKKKLQFSPISPRNQPGGGRGKNQRSRSVTTNVQ